MLTRQLVTRAFAAPWWAGIQFLVEDKGHPGRRIIATDMTLEALEDDGRPINPTFTLQPDQAQVLMDDLWNCGIRPTEGRGSAGSLAATERHLKDMQSLVFEHLIRARG